MKLHLIYLLSICTVISSVIPRNAQAQLTRGSKIKTVVIDAGHGGKDPGASRMGVNEKDINLKVALLLGSMIENNLNDVSVIYTRKNDTFIELDERANIANKANADLFISIHVNANKMSVPTGSYTLVMGVDKLGKNLDVTMRENDVVTYEKDYSTKYEGYVPGSTESYIMFSLMQYAYLDQSIVFANTIQKSYALYTDIPSDRGVQQAPLLVLWRTTMPSVLTEIGFISNEEDRKFMTSSNGQQRIALSLFNAFSEYKCKAEGNPDVFLLKVSDITTITTETEEAPIKTAPKTETTVKPETGNKVEFMVQIKSSTKKLDTKSATNFGVYKGKVIEKKSGNIYKYFVGRTDSFKTASATQKVAATKFKGAFIVAFKNDKQITITESMKK